MNFNSISLISRIRESANKFILKELKSAGFKDIFPSHGDIMVLLYKFEKLNMQELAKKINRTKPTVTVLVDKLIALGLIKKEKSIQDNRVIYIKLTDEGIKFKSVFENISKELMALAYNNFSDNEAELLEKLLTKMKNNFQ